MLLYVHYLYYIEAYAVHVTQHIETHAHTTSNVPSHRAKIRIDHGQLVKAGGRTIAKYINPSIFRFFR